MGSVDEYSLGCSASEERGWEWIGDLHDCRISCGALRIEQESDSRDSCRALAWWFRVGAPIMYIGQAASTRWVSSRNHASSVQQRGARYCLWVDYRVEIRTKKYNLKEGCPRPTPASLEDLVSRTQTTSNREENRLFHGGRGELARRYLRTHEI